MTDWSMVYENGDPVAIVIDGREWSIATLSALLPSGPLGVQTLLRRARADRDAELLAALADEHIEIADWLQDEHVRTCLDNIAERLNLGEAFAGVLWGRAGKKERAVKSERKIEWKIEDGEVVEVRTLSDGEVVKYGYRQLRSDYVAANLPAIIAAIERAAVEVFARRVLEEIDEELRMLRTQETDVKAWKPSAERDKNLTVLGATIKRAEHERSRLAGLASLDTKTEREGGRG